MDTSGNCILSICSIILSIYFGWCCVQGARLLRVRLANGQMGHLVAQMAIYTKWPFEKKLRVWRANFTNDKMAIWAADRPFGQLGISPIHRPTICKWLDRFSLSSLPILYHHPYSSC